MTSSRSAGDSSRLFIFGATDNGQQAAAEEQRIETVMVKVAEKKALYKAEAEAAKLAAEAKEAGGASLTTLSPSSCRESARGHCWVVLRRKTQPTSGLSVR